MKYGLRDDDVKTIVDIISTFNEIESAVLFGSRAKGTYKPGSDIDLAVTGCDVNFDIISKLDYQLNEKIILPYMFDVVDYSHLNHKELKEHIQRVGKVIFSKSNDGTLSVESNE